MSCTLAEKTRLNKKLGPLAYTNPSLLLSQGIVMPELKQAPPIQLLGAAKPQNVSASDFMKILCPKCKNELNIQL
jgi:hypothetical protein